MRIVELTTSSRKDLLARLLKRDPNQYGSYAETVREIVEKVKAEGDKALFEYTRRFDHTDLTAENIRVTPQELEEGAASVGQELTGVLRRSMENIRRYHEKQLVSSWMDIRPDGTILGQKITPMDCVGVYVPGGRAPLASTVLMNIVPAVVAGVPRIVMMTPPGKDGKVNPVILAAAKLTGVKEIYKAGGAQAIAAMAFGTESVPRVNKVIGPGNIFVALAKKAVYGHVSIDSIAGPSEIMVLADETADPRFVAADLLSQAEHDELACAILVTDSRKLAEEVSKLADEYAAGLERREIIEKSLENYGYILLVSDRDEAFETVNEIAPEHLEIQTANPFEDMARVRNAGAIFLGPYSSEPLGDYYAGPNHVLPTNGTAKFFSPLGVDAYLKKSSIIYYSEEALREAKDDIIRFARQESLTAHANSISVRFGED